MAKTNNPKAPLTPDLEKFKYEVAQEIGILTRKNKKYPTQAE
ncbi:MAG: small, acid-soluble spore protein, alpha/beta type [Desulfitobacterium hafniense]|nr:small, acid-soluble spore protein, alpha/beta type [Desulfitobacterium hafniense]